MMSFEDISLGVDVQSAQQIVFQAAGKNGHLTRAVIDTHGGVKIGNELGCSFWLMAVMRKKYTKSR